MRSLVFLILAIIPSFVHSQNKQAISEPIEFNLAGNRPIERQSKPIHLKIGYNEFYGLSNPVQFNVGVELKTKEIEKIDVDEKITEIKEEHIESLNNIPNYYSLIIGINDYESNDLDLRDLKQPIADASILNQILIDKYHFKKENTTFLSNPTRNDILNEFERLAKTLTEKDNLVIFYAGHGIWDERIKVGYWIPSDGDIRNKSNWLSNSTIRDYIAGINSKHTLLISDACFSGSIFKTRGTSLTAVGMASLYRMPSRKAMSSGTLTIVPDESKFMYYLMKRLNEFQGEYLSSKQLFYSIETAVLNNTSTVPQYGTIQDTGDEGGDFIFIKSK